MARILQMLDGTAYRVELYQNGMAKQTPANVTKKDTRGFGIFSM
jgi:hypothetical protein